MTKKSLSLEGLVAASLACLPLFGALGCGSINGDIARWFRAAPDPATLPAIVEPRVFLGGEALAQKKERMRRIRADLAHLYESYEIVARQQKRADQQQLERLIRPYIETQAKPLLASEDEAWNPDLRVLEADLLVAEAALYGSIGDGADLAAVIATLETRFRGYESLLVQVPAAGSKTLANAIADLRRARATL